MRQAVKKVFESQSVLQQWRRAEQREREVFVGNKAHSKFLYLFCGLVSPGIKWLNYGFVTCMLVGLFLFWSQPIKAANYGQELENNAPAL